MTPRRLKQRNFPFQTICREIHAIASYFMQYYKTLSTVTVVSLETKRRKSPSFHSFSYCDFLCFHRFFVSFCFVQSFSPERGKKIFFSDCVYISRVSFLSRVLLRWSRIRSHFRKRNENATFFSKFRIEIRWRWTRKPFKKVKIFEINNQWSNNESTNNEQKFFKLIFSTNLYAVLSIFLRWCPHFEFEEILQSSINGLFNF